MVVSSPFSFVHNKSYPWREEHYGRYHDTMVARQLASKSSTISPWTSTMFSRSWHGVTATENISDFPSMAYILIVMRLLSLQSLLATKDSDILLRIKKPLGPVTCRKAKNIWRWLMKVRLFKVVVKQVLLHSTNSFRGRDCKTMPTTFFDYLFVWCLAAACVYHDH